MTLVVAKVWGNVRCNTMGGNPYRAGGNMGAEKVLCLIQRYSTIRRLSVLFLFTFVCAFNGIAGECRAQTDQTDLRVSRYDFEIGINVKAETLTIRASVKVENLGKQEVGQLKFTLPEDAQMGRIRVDSEQVERGSPKDNDEELEGKTYRVTLPAPLAPENIVELEVNYLLPHEDGRKEWQIRRDYAMGWENWFPRVAGVRTCAAPYRMSFRSSGSHVPITSGFREKAGKKRFEYDCPAPIEPFFVSGLFDYSSMRVGPMYADVYGIVKEPRALVQLIIAPVFGESMKTIGQVVGMPAYKRIKFVVVKQDALPFADKPFLCWANSKWFRNPTITKANYALITSKIARAWFVDSWTAVGERKAFLTMGLCAYFGWYGTRANYGREQARFTALRFQKSADATYFHDAPQLADDSVLNASPYILSHCHHAMLVGLLGEQLYHAALGKFFKANRGKTVTVSDFEQFLEAESGQELSWFFETWVGKAALADYRFEGRPRGVMWRKCAATEFSVRNTGAGRMKIAVEGRSVTGETKTEWIWVDPGAESQVRIITNGPLETVEIDPDKRTPQTGVSNDVWHNPLLGKDMHVIEMRDGRSLKGRIVKETDSAYTLDLGLGRAMIAKANVKKLRTSKYGRYLKQVRLNSLIGKPSQLDLAYLAAANDWNYEACFHAQRHLVRRPDNDEAKAIIRRYGR